MTRSPASKRRLSQSAASDQLRERDVEEPSLAVQTRPFLFAEHERDARGPR